jgi:ABC-type transport system substrate-binding protein
MTTIHQSLTALASLSAEYDPALLAARRIAFLAQVERYSIGARLDDIAAAFVTADPETRQELIEEAAELLTKEDCDANPE